MPKNVIIVQTDIPIGKPSLSKQRNQTGSLMQAKQLNQADRQAQAESLAQLEPLTQAESLAQLEPLTQSESLAQQNSLALSEPPSKTNTLSKSEPPLQPGLVSVDRRSLRSRKMMREALASLIAERGLGNFTVSDLMDKADLNRSTFYGHYSDLDDLLAELKQEIVDDLAVIKPRLLNVSLPEVLAFERSGRPPKVTIEVFDTLREHGKLLAVLLGPHGDSQFQAQLRDVVCTDMVRSVLHDKYTREPNALVEYYISYYASALLGLIQRWLEKGMVEDSPTMGRIMLSIMFLKPGDSIKLKGRK